MKGPNQPLVHAGSAWSPGPPAIAAPPCLRLSDGEKNMSEQALRFATFLAPNMLPVYQFIADRVGEKLGCRTELAVGKSFNEFEAGQTDIGFI